MTTSPLASPAATRSALDAYGLATKHRLGQNFLVDGRVIEKIMALAELAPTDRVLEVGPGIGTLTLALVQEAESVFAVEADRELAPVLADLAAAHPNLSFAMGDALRVPVTCEPKAFVSNLPYNVAATLVLKCFGELPSLERAVVMVQAEVADRICAAPGSRVYGAYTAKLALFAEPRGRFEVGRSCFMPAPHVDSAVVRLDRRAEPLVPAALVPAVVSAIDAAFSQRRKTIRNSMAGAGFAKSALDAAFAAAGIDPAARAETLAPSDFVRLALALEESHE